MSNKISNYNPMLMVAVPNFSDPNFDSVAGIVRASLTNSNRADFTL